MGARPVLACAVLAMALGAGCSRTTTLARCELGETTGCSCAGRMPGLQTCTAVGTYAPCVCSGPARCVPGTLSACACPDGARGAQECSAVGAYEPCDCEAPPAPACVPGAAAPCACLDGSSGAQVCGESGSFGACACEPPSDRCVPGRAIECACGGGVFGAQICAPDGAYGPCACGPLDAAAVDLDAGLSLLDVPRPDAPRLDAGPADAPRRDAGEGGVCDPYLGDSCGCDEALPPPAPTLPRTPPGPLASGTGTLVDFFVAETGVIVIRSDRVTLLSRAGATLATWMAPREIRAAAFDGRTIAIADRAAVTSLDTSLAEGVSTFLTEECASSVVVSCDRFVCGPSNDWDRIFYTYDLAGGGEIARSRTYTYNGIPMRRVPGVDAFVSVTVGSSPSDFHYYRVEPSGEAVFTTESPYHGDFAVTDTYAFHGRPATHLITHEGRMLRIDGCLDATRTSTDCLTLDGALGTLRTGERFHAMERGADGYLYALAGSATSWSDDPPCPASGCRVQRIDPAARTIVSERAPAVAPTRLGRLRHDPWAGRVILSSGTSCSTSYPYTCSNWAISTNAYD